MRWPGTEGDVESLDYDPFESQVDRIGSEINYSNGHEKRRLVYARWICTFIVGIATALCGVFLLYFTLLIGDHKRQLLERVIQLEKAGEARFGFAYGIILLINMSLVLCAVLLIVFGETISAGSGVSEIKTTLNGVNIPHVLRLRTLVCKLIGTVCSVAGGLPVGKEGPMIHSGAIMGAGLSQGKSSTLGYDTSFTYFSGFRNDREKRDFVCCGAAAGVAAAFGAPIGGVLFVLEEGASFWHQTLTWRTFFCAMTSTFTLTLFLSGFQPSGKLGTLGSQSGTFSFGYFGSSTYEFWEIFVFISMGIGGGLAGALFNAGSTKWMKWRSRWITTKWRCIIEALFVAFMVSSLSFSLPLFFGNCHPRPGNNDLEKNTSFIYRNEMIALYCDDSAHRYNDLGTLFLSSGENAIKQLFHAPANTFSLWNLVLFSSVYMLLACWTYGIKVPSGLFVPSLLIGAAYGRILTHIINYLTQDLNLTQIDERTYGLIGGAAMLGGVTRMTISLTVILLECTGNIQYGLPLMVTLFAARWAGNYFNEGIYDNHIHLRHLPFLDWNPPVLGTCLLVKHVMTKNPKCFRIIERAGIIYDVLLNSSHHGFPVYLDVENSNEKLFSGIILRKHLAVILEKKDFCIQKPCPFTRKVRKERGKENMKETSQKKERENFETCLSYKDMEGLYPRYPRIHLEHCEDSLRVTESERRMWVDLTPYINETPYVIQEDAAFTRAYRLFRSSGLRHLIVVERHNYIRGILTRKDLEEVHCSRCYRLALGAGTLPIPSVREILKNHGKSRYKRKKTQEDERDVMKVPLLDEGALGSSSSSSSSFRQMEIIDK